MKKKYIIIIYLISIIFIVLTTFTNTTYALTAGELYGNTINGNKLYSPARIVLGIIKWAGTAILIGRVIVKGIQYVSISPEGKASIKKDMVMLLVGAVLLFGFATILDVIYNASSNVNSLT